MDGQTNVHVWRMTLESAEFIIAVLEIFCFEVAIIFEMFSKILDTFLVMKPIHDFNINLVCID